MNSADSILLVDDEQTILDTLSLMLREEGFPVDTAPDGETALQMAGRKDYRLIICDVVMPRMGGIELLAKLKERGSGVMVILMTAFGDITHAVEAMKMGAVDYIVKPFIIDEVITIARRACASGKGELTGGSGIVGESPEMLATIALLDKSAESDCAVLITGESGVGKELAAAYIHRKSPRSGNSLVPVNCAAIPLELFESEMFGVVKGAFTNALQSREGLVTRSDKGTLFLDEICSLPFAMQGKLLRVLESHEVMPVGSGRSEKVDLRLIAATNKSLEDEVKAGRFREDLYYRLRVFEVHLPPLRARKTDIPLLARHYLGRCCEKYKKRIEGFSPEVEEHFLRHPWPGNVRELKNVIERAVLVTDGGIVTMASLQQNNLAPSALRETGFVGSYKESMAQSARELILNALAHSGNDKKKAAQTLGLSLSSLYRKMEELGISTQ
ncbi:MAG: sigma-54-dependent Fis family transcriptional regulator [Nitrospinae bacterium]|nr:sigma-54-dependent Fis family transcriptional regulator [Nitrospinota bacterium]